MSKTQRLDNQRFVKIRQKSRFFDQETAWLKKIDSQTTICKILLSGKTGGPCRGRSCAGPQKMFDFISSVPSHASNPHSAFFSRHPGCGRCHSGYGLAIRVMVPCGLWCHAGCGRPQGPPLQSGGLTCGHAEKQQPSPAATRH